MTGWTPHRTAQQRQRDRSPLARKVDRAALAPAVTVPAVMCGDCSHVRLIHRDGLKCLTLGCGCMAYVEVADG